MAPEFLTLKDIDIVGKTVFLRLDINSPIDPETGQILDDTRIRAAAPTVKELSKSRLVIGSHQSRPGKDDFTSLRAHAAVLRRYCGRNVKFIDDVMGPSARAAIQELRNGEVLVLDNLRFCSEENIEAPAKQLVKTHLVRRLAPLFDVFVNDAFAAAHRSQASLVGFAELMPSAAGLIMEKEIKNISGILQNPRRPCVYLLGGVKVSDRVAVIENALKSQKVDYVLLGGLLGEFFLKAAGFNLGVENEKKLQEHLKFLDKARSILASNKDKIVLPVDLAVNREGERVDLALKDFPVDEVIMDIGIETTAKYSSILKNAGSVITDGPLGVFEYQAFNFGTKGVLEAMAESKAFTLAGGGHVAGALEILGLADKISHISTGGGAMLALLAGDPLPAVEALKRSAKRFKGKL
ncbi:MAG: phosphoglycerate kinase [Candidatus Bathyarchaeia archaeon]